MEGNEKFSWRARGRSFKYAFRGIGMLVGGEHNARIHCVVALLVVIAGFVFGISALEWIAVTLCIGGVLMAECFNSAIEALCDKVSPEHDPLIGRAKDMAAGAVLLFVIAAIVVGLIVFIPKIWGMLNVEC